MYSPAVGACAPAFSADINHQSVQKNFGLDLRCIQPSAMASQYTFIVTTKLATKATQLSSEITLGATRSNATVKMILTNSHTNKPTKAEPGWVRRICRLKALTKTTPGITTANAPQATETAKCPCPVTHPVSNAITAPTPACNHNTRQGEVCTWSCRQAWASSAVKGLNSGANTSSTASVDVYRTLACGDEVILTISNYIQVTHWLMQQSLTLYVETRAPSLFLALIPASCTVCVHSLQPGASFFALQAPTPPSRRLPICMNGSSFFT